MAKKAGPASAYRFIGNGLLSVDGVEVASGETLELTSERADQLAAEGIPLEAAEDSAQQEPIDEAPSAEGAQEGGE